jgi:hypothetical protein
MTRKRKSKAVRAWAWAGWKTDLAHYGFTSIMVRKPRQSVGGSRSVAVEIRPTPTKRRAR